MPSSCKGFGPSAYEELGNTHIQYLIYTLLDYNFWHDTCIQRKVNCDKLHKRAPSKLYQIELVGSGNSIT